MVMLSTVREARSLPSAELRREAHAVLPAGWVIDDDDRPPRVSVTDMTDRLGASRPAGTCRR